jgi:hypothetical protein
MKDIWIWYGLHRGLTSVDDQSMWGYLGDVDCLFISVDKRIEVVVGELYELWPRQRGQIDVLEHYSKECCVSCKNSQDILPSIDIFENENDPILIDSNLFGTNISLVCLSLSRIYFRNIAVPKAATDIIFSYQYWLSRD